MATEGATTHAGLRLSNRGALGSPKLLPAVPHPYFISKPNKLSRFIVGTLWREMLDIVYISRGRDSPDSE